MEPTKKPILSETPELPHGPEKLLPPPHKTSYGALAGITIIIIVLVIGALYVWSTRLTEVDQPALPIAPPALYP